MSSAITTCTPLDSTTVVVAFMCWSSTWYTATIIIAAVAALYGFRTFAGIRGSASGVSPPRRILPALSFWFLPVVADSTSTAEVANYLLLTKKLYVCPYVNDRSPYTTVSVRWRVANKLSTASTKTIVLFWIHPKTRSPTFHLITSRRRGTYYSN